MHAVTLTSDNFTARLKYPSVVTAFNALVERFTSEHMATSIQGIIAARIEDPRSMTTFEALFNRLTSKLVVTLDQCLRSLRAAV